MYDILSANPVVLRDKTNNRSQAASGLRLPLLALLYFKGKYLECPSQQNRKGISWYSTEK